MLDNKGVNISELISSFRTRISGMSEASLPSYRKAVANFEAFAGTYYNAVSFPSECFLADWLLSMWLQGLTAATAIHYYDIISALCHDMEVADASLFRTFKKKIKGAYTQGFDFDKKLFKGVVNVTKSVTSQPGELAEAADMLMFSLLNNAMPVLEVAKQRVGDISCDRPELSALIKRQSSPRRKYIFNLGQSKLTDRQLRAFAEQKLSDLFRMRNIAMLGSVDNTVRAVMAYSALCCGMSGSEVLAMMGTAPAGMPLLSLCEVAEIDTAGKSALMRSVTSIFVENPMRWYPMKLRPRVDFKTMTDRVAQAVNRGASIEFFYPYDEIKKRIGKKLVTESVPVIKDIVFFRARVTDIFPLFCKIGDIAWCYTTTGKPGGDYAAIPRHQFERFQETIGQFTSDYEVAPIGGFEPEEGERVVVLSGLLADREFDISKIEDGDNTVFQLRMIGDNGIQWRTRARKHQLKTTTAGCNG